MLEGPYWLSMLDGPARHDPPSPSRSLSSWRQPDVSFPHIDPGMQALLVKPLALLSPVSLALFLTRSLLCATERAKARLWQGQTFSYAQVVPYDTIAILLGDTSKTGHPQSAPKITPKITPDFTPDFTPTFTPKIPPGLDCF